MRTILHCDCNNFYAAVEETLNPALSGNPVIVCGDPSLRHGIVLSKSYAAKACGVKTGEALWEARLKCPTAVMVPANQRRYLAFSRKMRSLCHRYSSQVESFGLDENWLDVSGHPLSGEEIAARIRKSVKDELGITVSIGVSFNKVFAKLGSEMRKPDATTVISQNNFRQKIWPLPASELLFIGHATTRHLQKMGIFTIGELARCPPQLLQDNFGKNGLTMWRYANGKDDAQVLSVNDADDVKSIGNSTTALHDIANVAEAKTIIYLLSDSVATRLRKHDFCCHTVSLWMRDTQLNSFERQCKLPQFSDISDEIAQAAMSLLDAHYPWELPLRSLGVRGTELINMNHDMQEIIATDPIRTKGKRLEHALDDIRKRWGHTHVRRGLMICD